MRRALVLLLIVSSIPLTGCDSLQKKHDNPVMVAAPRRVDPVETAETEETETKYADNSAEKLKEDDGSDIEQVRMTLANRAAQKNPWEDWKDDTAIFNSQVAATVNGAPILNGEVLDKYAGYLISVREQLQKVAKDPKMLKPGQPLPTPEDYAKHREQLIQGSIAVHIQRKLLVERLKAGLKPDQVKAMNSHIDELFEKEIQRLKQELKVSNKTELELELNKKGTTLQNVKDNFANDRLSQECIGVKSEKADKIDRPEMLAYYQAHEDKFQVVAKVKWQQIQVSITPEVNKKAARKTLDQAVSELNEGVPFEKVARKYSDGPNAKEGGTFDWMEAGNLADTKLEKKLFSMPLNKLSDVHEGPNYLCVVRVTDREEAGRKPFREVQEEVHGILELEMNRKRSKKFMRELFTSAVIETQYSLPQFVPEEE